MNIKLERLLNRLSLSPRHYIVKELSKNPSYLFCGQEHTSPRPKLNSSIFTFPTFRHYHWG